MTDKTKRRTGGILVHLDDETKWRVEEYATRFQEDNPGIRTTPGDILANLIHHGLAHVESGPFRQLRSQEEAIQQLLDALNRDALPIPYSVADDGDATDAE